MCEAVNNILCHGTVQLFRPATPHCISRLAQRGLCTLLLLCSEVILSKRFIVNSRCHQQCGLPYTMYKAASNVGSFISKSLLRDLGSGERISADYCHQKTSLPGRVASHQSTGMVTDWIVGKVMPSDLEAVEQGFCSEDKNAQNMNICTNLEVFASHRQKQSL